MEKIKIFIKELFIKIKLFSLKVYNKIKKYYDSLDKDGKDVFKGVSVLILIIMLWIFIIAISEIIKTPETREKERVNEICKFLYKDIKNEEDAKWILGKNKDEVPYSISECKLKYGYENNKAEKLIDKVKLETEKRQKEEKEKKEAQELEKRNKEELDKKKKECELSQGEWQYNNTCKTKEKIAEELEKSKKDCLSKSNYVWTGTSCEGKEWIWQGNDRTVNSDPKVSSYESKITNEVFNAVESKGKDVDILDSGNGYPWAISIKMKGNSLSEYTVVFYIKHKSSLYRAIVKNGNLIN